MTETPSPVLAATQPKPIKDLRRAAPAHRRFVSRLGPHHFAHLRATAEGIDLVQSARRYLGIEHGLQAVLLQ